MSDCPAYDAVNHLTMSYLASSADGAVANMARSVEKNLPLREVQTSANAAHTTSERLVSARRMVSQTPFNQVTFESIMIDLEECAEKRYLMALAAFRIANGHSVVTSASQDIEVAMRLDPGNVEYLQFAEQLLENLGDQGLKRQIESEQAFIRRLREQGASEHGGWVYG